ncbi:class I SAM-dependent methyltransferase [Pseudomonas kuykendallii]|uniref:class I SAM-dependent methyltransferase n=1 Tax=Pseudomonas kuykendallii TaxID=1007099 RepID=UPI002352EC62|nr:class I SAM-dependent methyltransferase [Pseudomonas kuykendallii]
MNKQDQIQSAYAEGNYKYALRLLDDLVESAGPIPEWDRYRAAIMYKLGETAAAFDAYRQAFALQAENQNRIFNDVLMMAQSQYLASSEFGEKDEQVTDFISWGANALCEAKRRGEVLFRNGDFEAALVELEAAFAHCPTDSELANDIAVILYRLGNTAEALAMFQVAHKLGGSTELVATNLLEVLEHQIDVAAIDAASDSLPMAEALPPGRVVKPRIDGNYLHYPDVSLEVCIGDAMYQRNSSADCFVLGKTWGMVEALLKQLPTPPKRILELGIWKGGSVVLFNEMFVPEKLVALDFNTNVTKYLVDYVSQRKNIALSLGVDQADKKALHQLYVREFVGQKLDLVLDDASHFYEQSRASFEALFPLLAVGGIYVVEDWGWAQWPGDHWQVNEGGDYFRDRKPLANLIIELTLLAASQPSLVAGVVVESGSVYVRRGPANIESDLDLDSLILNRGRPIPKLY